MVNAVHHIRSASRLCLNFWLHTHCLQFAVSPDLNPENTMDIDPFPFFFFSKSNKQPLCDFGLAWTN